MDFPYELRQIDEFGKIPNGSQIAVKCSFESFHPSLAFFYPLISSDQYYYHHGVYMGNYQVIHFSGEDKDDAKLRICDLFKFLTNSVDCKIYLVKYDDPKHLLPVEDTINLAKEVLQDPSLWPEYHVIGNNCESFATWLKTGKKVSAQAAFALHRVISLVATAVGSSVALCLRR